MQIEVSASEIKYEKKADDRGRVTLGSEHAGKTVTVAVLEVEDDDCVESDDVATDGGTVRRETPQTAATEHPTVLDIDVVGDRALASVEKGDVSVVVEAPAGISAEELEQTLSGVPKSIERTTGQFAETPRMSDDTTELDGSIDTEDATEDDLGGGV